MPTIRNVGGKKPAKAEKQIITKNDVGTVDASTLPLPQQRPTGTMQPVPTAKRPTGTMQPVPTANRPTGKIALTVPAFLQQTAMPETVEREQTGYVGFASTRSKQWPTLQANNVADGMPYLSKDSQILPLPQLKFFLLRAESFQTLMVGEAGDFKFVTRDLEMEGPAMGSNKTEPHYVGLLIVFTPQGMVPVKGDFRGTKSGGFESAIAAIRAASTPEWAQISDAHRVSCAFPQPFGRVVTTITTRREVSKTSGNPYFRTIGQIVPATPTEMQTLGEAFSDETFNATLAEANKNYEARIAFFDDLIRRNCQPVA